MILRNGKFSGKILRKIFHTGKFSTAHQWASELVWTEMLQEKLSGLAEDR
jgi:hypothetical protein